MGYDPSGWESFAVAEVGAAAALAGLLVVATSININRIIEFPWIVSRLAATLVLFGAVLVVATLLLVPRQPRIALGVEIAAAGVIALWVLARLGRARPDDQRYRTRAASMIALGVVASALIIAAGAFTAVGILGGLYWVVPATILAFAIGLANTWVALVEILR